MLIHLDRKAHNVDKAFWNAIVENDFAVPQEHTVQDLTPELLGFLSSTDIEVRDPFGYMILAHWIVRDKHYSADELRNIRDQLIANLDTGIGEKETDTVFLRSFSMLILSLLVYYDMQDSFLSDEELKKLLSVSLAYFQKENDLRGYVPVKGWAHSTAHTADILKFISRNPKTDKAGLIQILNGIIDKLLPPVETYVYIHSEDERLVMALMDIVKRDLLDESDWDAWINRFVDWKNNQETGDFQPEIHTPWLNCKNLLRSFYFQLALVENLPEVAPKVQSKVLEAIKVFGQH